jgi:hypothetical protein
MPTSGSISVAYAAGVTVTETVGSTPATASSGSNATLVHDQFNKTATLTSSTTPPVTKHAAFEKALAAGTGTIDLTALAGTNSGTIDGTGLKVQVAYFKAKAANGNPITIDVGDSNGYELSGSAFSITLQPGQEALIYGNDATPDVASGDKVLDLTGTGTDALQVEIVLG